MKKVICFCSAAVLSVVLTGCLSIPITLVPSTDPVSQGEYTVLGSEVSGTDTQVGFLFFTFGAHGSCTRRAIQDAINQAPGADSLVRVAMEDEYFNFFFLLDFYKVRVTGTPVKINKREH